MASAHRRPRPRLQYPGRDGQPGASPPQNILIGAATLIADTGHATIQNGGSARVLPSLLITHYGLSSDAPNVAATSM